MTDAGTIALFTPPGQFMCCICFEFFPENEAWTDADNQKWNMCQADGEKNG